VGLVAFQAEAEEGAVGLMTPLALTQGLVVQVLPDASESLVGR
jgi:hypothetical protein